MKSKGFVLSVEINETVLKVFSLCASCCLISLMSVNLLGDKACKKTDRQLNRSHFGFVFCSLFRIMQQILNDHMLKACMKCSKIF
jgi:hypothetical protein